MEIRQLRHFVALVEEGGLIQAARRESIVQSGLSSSIMALENELGVQLCVKGTRTLRLTAEGGRCFRWLARLSGRLNLLTRP